MTRNSFYESKNNFGRLIKRESFKRKEDIWTVKRVSLSGKYIATMFRECRGSGIGFTNMFHIRGFAEKYFTGLLLVLLIFMFFYE